MADMDHEGHGGWRIGHIDTNIAGWFAAIDDPDIILLHIGTNDFGSDANAINRLDALITKMAGLRPGAHIIVTNLMERGEPQNSNIQTQFNPFVEGVVDDQIAAGNLVSFLDMRAAVPLSDMPDNVHPNQTGYGKMAGAWLGAIEAIIDLDDAVPPSIISASSSQSRDQVVVRFNRPLDETTAETASNYALSGGLSVLSAVLSANPRVVTLATDAQTPGETYTLTVNGVQDQVTPTPNTIANDSMVEFTTAPLPGAVGRVSAGELAGMQLLYAVDGDQFDFNDPYTIDNSAGHPTGSFTRVAYFVELGTAGDTQWTWVSMDTFNSDPLLVGVPRAGTDIVEQGTVVTNLNVESNHPNLASVVGTGKTGTIEFWASNYNQNGVGEFGSDDTKFDWKDGGARSTANGHGSFQVFAFTDANQDSANTVFGITANGGSGIGDQIPNGAGGSQDWTFGPGTGTYEVRNVEIWVGFEEDELPPLALVSAAQGQSGTQITVFFNRPLDPTSAETASNYTLSGGLTVLSAVISADQSAVILTTSEQSPEVSYTLTVSGVQDLATPTPNTVAGDSMTEFTTAPLPGALGRVSAGELAGMQLLYAVDDDQFDFEDAYTVDNSADHPTGSFPRVAYFVELGSDGDTQWVWASMDTFNSDPTLVGVPRSGSNIVERGTLVTNLNIESNHPNLAPLNGVTGQNGIIEFWASDYTNIGAGQFNSDDGLFDWKDSNTGNTNFGYGSFQVFHLDGTAPEFTDGVGTTVFGLTRNGGSGIGDQPGNGPNNNSPDWTYGPGTGTYEIRNVEVWVGSSTPLAPFEIVAIALNAAGDGVTITFNSIPNATYAADYSLDMVEWIEIDNSIPSGGMTTEFSATIMVDGVVPPKLFYRVRLP